VTVRPLVQITGNKGFNEVFFETCGCRRKTWSARKFRLAGRDHNADVRALGRGGDRGGMSQVRELAAGEIVARNGATAWDDGSVRRKSPSSPATRWRCDTPDTGSSRGAQRECRRAGRSMMSYRHRTNMRIQLFAMELLGRTAKSSTKRRSRSTGQVVVQDARGARRHDCAGSNQYNIYYRRARARTAQGLTRRARFANYGKEFNRWILTIRRKTRHFGPKFALARSEQKIRRRRGNIMADEGRGRLEARVTGTRSSTRAAGVAVNWPKEYGGRGATVMQRLIYREELGRLGLNEPMIGMGISCSVRR